jgi:serine protease Do
MVSSTLRMGLLPGPWIGFSTPFFPARRAFATQSNLKILARWLNPGFLPLLLTLAVLVLPAGLQAEGGELDQKVSVPRAETTLVQVKIITETKGASESVEIDGKRAADYRPTIIQVFPSTGVVIDEKGNVLTYLGYRWVDIRSSNPRIDIISGEGQKCRGKLIGIDQNIGVAVVRALEGKLKKTPLCLSCEIRDGTTIMTPVNETTGFHEFRTAQILSVGALTNAAEQGSWAVTVSQPLPDVGEPILSTDHLVLGFVASQKPSRSDPMGVHTIVYPMSQLMNAAEKILRVGGDIRTGWLGVYLDMDSESPSGRGVMIKEVEEDSPAQRAGLNAKDIVVKWNGRAIRDVLQFIQTVQNTAIGSRINLNVLREGIPLDLSALVEARKPSEGPGRLVFNFPGTISMPAAGAISAGEIDAPVPRIGIETVRLTPELADFLQMPGQSGLLVLKVDARMAAAQAGVLVGDVITSVDGVRILDPQVFSSHIQARGWGGRLSLRLLHKGAERSADIHLPKPSSPKP